MKLSSLALATALIVSPAYAENIVIGCPLLQKYSEGQVNLLFSQAVTVVGQQEVGKIYNRYVALKRACQTDGAASRVVPISAALRNWLTGNGVDIKKLASRSD